MQGLHASPRMFYGSTEQDGDDMNASAQPRSIFKRHGLSLSVLLLIVLSLAGHIETGWHYSNDQRREHHQPQQPMGVYLRSGDFLSSLLENWESEFLQMGLFVLLTVRLRQVGSAESRPFDREEEAANKKQYPRHLQPWPVRRGGWWKRAYEQSLAIALLSLFVLSFIGHWYNSWRQHRDEQLFHGEVPESLGDYIFDAEFWFQSFQNWQSEFVAILALVLLSIVLRQKDSPQSKQVEAPHSHTGH